MFLWVVDGAECGHYVVDSYPRYVGVCASAMCPKSGVGLPSDFRDFEWLSLVPHPLCWLLYVCCDGRASAVNLKASWSVELSPRLGRAQIPPNRSWRLVLQLQVLDYDIHGLVNSL